MSVSFNANEFARLGDGARGAEARAETHERQMETLLATAEADVELALAALADVPEGTLARVDHFVLALRAQLHRSRHGVDIARQLCVRARENRLAASRLVSELRDQRESGTVSPARVVRHAVLVVDDHDDIRELVATLLDDAGFIVRTASNGLEAIIAAYEMRPAVIVMDVSMPVLDGLEATRLIKAIDAIRDARIIAYTATPTLSAVYVNPLFAAVLEKPAPLDAVLAAVRQLAA